MGSWSIYFDNREQVKEFLARHEKEFTTQWDAYGCSLVSISTGELMGSMELHTFDGKLIGEAHWID